MYNGSRRLCCYSYAAIVWVGVDQRGNSSSAGQVASDIGWITTLTPTYQPAYSASKQYLHTESLTYFIQYVQLVPKIQVGIERQCSAYAVAYFRRIGPASLTVGVGGSVKSKSPSHEHAVCHRFNPPFLHNTHLVFYFSIHQYVACSCKICRWRT